MAYKSIEESIVAFVDTANEIKLTESSVIVLPDERKITFDYDRVPDSNRSTNPLSTGASSGDIVVNLPVYNEFEREIKIFFLLWGYYVFPFDIKERKKHENDSKADELALDFCHEQKFDLLKIKHVLFDRVLGNLGNSNEYKEYRLKHFITVLKYKGIHV